MDTRLIYGLAALRQRGRAAASKCAALLSLAVLTGACGSKPPPDYAPDPGLVARIVELRMHVGAGRACPGNVISASYDAVLDDGSIVSVATRYDDEHPPPLHVVFLSRSSAQARPLNNGAWDTDADPLASAVSGFRLSAFLRAKPSVAADSSLFAGTLISASARDIEERIPEPCGPVRCASQPTPPVRSSVAR